jgi:hypothetical protein
LPKLKILERLSCQPNTDKQFGSVLLCMERFGMAKGFFSDELAIEDVLCARSRSLPRLLCCRAQCWRSSRLHPAEAPAAFAREIRGKASVGGRRSGPAARRDHPLVRLAHRLSVRRLLLECHP